MRSQLRISYSQQEILDKAQAWLKDKYGEIKQENPDKFHEKLGFLMDFLTDTFPKE